MLLISRPVVDKNEHSVVKDEGRVLQSSFGFDFDLGLLSQQTNHPSSTLHPYTEPVRFSKW